MESEKKTTFITYRKNLIDAIVKSFLDENIIESEKDFEKLQQQLNLHLTFEAIRSEDRDRKLTQLGIQCSR